ncbi:MAG: hypothetical protein ABID54_00115 [Pseudomonadota bacterium]
MTVKRLETAEEMAGLLAVKDDIEEYQPCTHSEWVQWLVSQADNPKVAVWANFEENRIDSYIVVFDLVNLPLSDYLFISYAFSVLGEEQNSEVLQRVKEWAKSLGVKRITATTKLAEELMKYGFVKIADVVELKVE